MSVCGIGVDPTGLAEWSPAYAVHGGIASTSRSRCAMSLRLAPVRMTMVGMPLATWCLEPQRARSMGFAPVLFQPTSREPKNCRQRHVPYRVGDDGATPPAASRGCAARRPPLAMQPTAGSRRCPSHSPFPAAADSGQYQSAVRIRCLSTPLGPTSSCVLHIGGSATLASAAKIGQVATARRLSVHGASLPVRQNKIES